MYSMIFFLLMNLFIIPTQAMEKKLAAKQQKTKNSMSLREVITRSFAIGCLSRNITGPQDFKPFSFEGVDFDIKKIDTKKQIEKNKKPIFFIIATIRERYPRIVDNATNKLKDQILRAIENKEVSTTDSYIFNLENKVRYIVSYVGTLNPETNHFKLQKEIKCFVFMR